MRRHTPLPIALAVGMMPVVMTACAPPMLLASAGFQALSNGTAVYVNGELEVAYRVPMLEVWAATRAAVDEMQFAIVDARIRSDYKALLFAEEFSGRSMTIAVTARTPVVTKVTVRVGFVGDQSLSRLIMDRIEAKMNEQESLPPIQPVPVVPVPQAEPVSPPDREPAPTEPPPTPAHPPTNPANP
jgi:hypothetical protein